ncbi:peptidase domain-containing ABC transporter [Maribacter sp.]|uniref:peptidase domain-containing ABC transporter n=1 Tax=Maribacter sp. TaxID=1897614 RepID=UPI0025B7AC17|nr:peptidase domain-containing ABC transporter [Maribacter sp.]
MKKFPFFRQHDKHDCGPTCLRMIAKYYGLSVSIDRLRHACSISMEGVTPRGIIEGGESIGLKALPALVDFDVLSKEVPLPCISYWRDRHFLIIYKIANDIVYVADPMYGHLEYSKENYIKAWQNRKDENYGEDGLIIMLEPTPEFYAIEGEKPKKGLSLIFSYVTQKKKYLNQIILGLVGGSLIQLAFPFITQAVVDQGISTGSISFITILLVAQLTLFVSSSFFSLIQGWLLLFVGSRASILMSTDYLRKLLKKSLSFFDSKTPGDIIQRINDSSRIEDLISSMPGTIFSYFNAIIFLMILLYYDFVIFTVFIIGVILYVLWVQFFMKKREELDFKRFDESSSVNSSLIQIVGGIQEIKVNNSEMRRIWSWEEIRIKLHKTAISSLKLGQYQIIGSNAINEIKNILITFLAAKGVIDGTITLGMMLAIQYIVGQINVPLNSLIRFLREIQDAKLSVERFTDIDFITDEEKTLNERDLIEVRSEPSDIVISNLSFRYGGSKSPMVLKNLNLTIPKGKVTAIVGMSGSGKTTLLKLLLKLYLPTEGTIRINNLNLNQVDTGSWRKLCGTVMQDGYIFSDTVARNITESNSFGDYDNKAIINAVKSANIQEFIESHPAGYNALIGPPGSSGRSLSGGQAQRILLARAIYKNPNYFFLDEATSALDANNEKIINDNLKSFYKDKTVLVIAHRLSTVKDADQIVVLKDGEIVESGSHDELLQNKNEYFELVKNQLNLGK